MSPRRLGRRAVSLAIRVLVALALLVVATLTSRPAFAHKPSDSYLTLEVEDAEQGAGSRIGGRWDVALRDLNNVMALDKDGSGTITWGEVRARKDEITSFTLGHLTLRSIGAPCPISPGGELEIASHSDGAYAVIHFRADCPQKTDVLWVEYQLFFDVDPQHHGIVRIDDGAGTRTAIFTPEERIQSFPRATLARSHQLYSAIKLGVHHIFAGIDHLLFLIALLLPSVLRRTPSGWQPVPKLRPALADVLKIVTAFTLAHSITLTLSALEVLRLPSRFVESGIAASVVLAAVNNVIPILEDDRWTAAFALGLLHGFGFSATLMDLGLPRQNLVLTLFGFNVGVEIGQMCVVAAFLPLAFFARKTAFYRRGLLVGGSIAIACVATLWLIERAFAVKIF